MPALAGGAAAVVLIIVGIVALTSDGPAEETSEQDSFDACISCFGSLNHILDIRDLEETFSRVHGALRPGGVFVFDLLNFVEDAMSCPPEEVREGRLEGIAYRSVLTSRVDT